MSIAKSKNNTHVNSVRYLIYTMLLNIIDKCHPASGNPDMYTLNHDISSSTLFINFL